MQKQTKNKITVDIIHVNLVSEIKYASSVHWECLKTHMVAFLLLQVVALNELNERERFSAHVEHVSFVLVDRYLIKYSELRRTSISVWKKEFGGNDA